jgi:4-hydroxybenzoate polyprenyltransferase
MLGGITMENVGFFESSILLLKSRKEIIMLATWTASLATIIAGRGFPPINQSLLAIISVLMLSLSVYIYNDIVDREMDAFSRQEKKKGRPIAHGIVSLNNAKRFVFLTGVIGFVASYLINIIAFSIGAIYYAIFFLYSYPKVRFKTMYIVKNVVTSLVMPITFTLCGAAIENTITTSTLLIAVGSYVFLFAFLPAFADMLDYDEDLAFNVKTLGNTLSWKQNLVLFNFGIVVIIATGVLAYRVFDFSYLVPILFSGFGVPAMVYSYMLRNENGITASYKIRPLGLALVMFTPLILSIGAVF